MPELASVVATKLETKFAERLLDAMSPMIVRPEEELLAAPHDELVAETVQAVREALGAWLTTDIALLATENRAGEQ